MSDILYLNEDILKLIYAYLNLLEKFTFTLVNKRLYDIFNDYRLLDTVFRVTNRHYIAGDFLFKNVITIKVLSETISNHYLANFKNLQAIDISVMKSMDFGKAKGLLHYLSNSLERIYVDNNDVKEVFELLIHVHSKSCIV